MRGALCRTQSINNTLTIMSKEWKGNKSSWRSMLGIDKRYTNNDRAVGDYYTTDTTAVEQFLRTYKLPCYVGTIWECACGCGNISEVLRKQGYNVFSTDLYDRGYGNTGIDFLQTKEPPKGCDTIITNPPYSLADEFVLHAMDILPLFGKYIALMNLSYLAGQKRHSAIYEMGYLHAIYIYPNRINCYKNNIPTGHSSPVNYAWFEFMKGTSSSPKLYWILK